MKLELIFKEMGKFIELKRSHELFSQNIRFLKKLFKFLKKKWKINLLFIIKACHK